MTKTKLAWSWRTKLVVLLVVFAVAPLGALAYWSVGMLGETFRTQALDGIEALASAKAEAVDQFTDRRIRDVERLANLLAADVTALQQADEEARAEAEKRRDAPSEPPVPPPEEKLPDLADVKAIESGASQPPPGDAGSGVEAPAMPLKRDKQDIPQALVDARRRLKSALGLILWDQKEFEELLIMDMDGKVIASTFAGHEGKTAASLEYYKNGRKATFVQPVFLSPITEQLTMIISTPIYDADREEVGVLAARLNLSRFFRLINETTSLGKTGETVVAKKIGDEIVFMAPTRHDDSAALQRKLAVGDPRSQALQEAARGLSGAGNQIDYRGVPTLAAWRHVPSLNWGLLVKIDAKEAMLAADEARQRTVVLAVSIIVLAILASMFAARALVRPLRDLKVATDRISRGDFDVQLDIHSKDEVGELADSFERMVAAIKFFREHQRESDDEEPDALLGDDQV